MSSAPYKVSTLHHKVDPYAYMPLDINLLVSGGMLPSILRAPEKAPGSRAQRIAKKTHVRADLSEQK